MPFRNSQRRFGCCSSQSEIPLSREISDTQFHGLLFSRLLYPFVDIYCFYSSGPSDLTKVARWIATWPSQNGPLWKPSLMVLLREKHLLQPDAAAVAERLFTSTITALTSNPLDFYFTGFWFLPATDSNSPAPIEAGFHEHLEVVRQRRRESGLLLSVEHTNELFERAFESAGTLYQQPVDLIRSARRDIPVSTELADHLVQFMSHIPLPEDLISFASPIIASSLVCDHYLPDMHLFNPQDVFQSLYRDICVDACKQATAVNRNEEYLLPSGLLASIVREFSHLFNRVNQGESPKDIHKSVLIGHSDRWTNIKTYRTCFSCLTRIPEHKLLCGHWICKNCVQMFGASEPADPYLFSLKNCLLDGDVVDLVVRVRPPTAGHSILCIDGGGVRGVIPPAILGQVEQQLGLPIPIQEFFTLAYGVSAGGLIVLAMFANGWSVERCGVEFQKLAKLAFRPPSTASVPGANWIRAILCDSLYSENDIEIALKSVFGEKALTEVAYAQRIGARIGIPAATIKQPSSLCLFTNYNSSMQETRGYTVLTAAENIKTWEVGRCASAALFYYRAKYLAGLGTFQDAGILANNPLSIALAEFAATNDNGEPDLVLNVGTGTSPNAPLRDEEPKLFTDSWMVRLKRAFMSQMQGRRIWDDVTSIDINVGRNCRRCRLDLTIANTPAIDDTTSMPVLISMVYRDDRLLRAVPKIAWRLFATLFYFELTALPQKRGSNFYVKGSILCTRKGRDAAIPKVANKLRRSKVYINGKPCRLTIESDEHGNIQQHLEFMTGQSLLIELKEEGSFRAFPISGSPYDITNLVKKGSTTAVFGMRTHKKRVRELNCSRPSKRRRLCRACLS
ncbi:patatin phospholipase [Fusarium mundagurra]|uniref:Patatin phospholipase n=1 Tax=Fusarium mundagurra TaxID=1567541 RepID=A0A8H6DPC4_9HYPO|nr:patatin phospholipase [Fusarium mundagurra]